MDQIAIYKQEFRLLGKRKVQASKTETVELLKAVESEIKKRRKPNTPDDLPVSLDERRAYDKASSMKIIKEYGGLLTHWDGIMTNLVKNK